VGVVYEQSCPRCGQDFVDADADVVVDAVVDHAREVQRHVVDREVVLAHLVKVHPHYFEVGQGNGSRRDVACG